MNRVVAIAVALIAGCGSPRPAALSTEPPAVEPRIAQIERGLLPAVQVEGEDLRASLAARMREYKIPAVSIAVFDRYELQWARAYGMADVAAGVPADVDTIFLAGSISKSVNAIAVLLAAADGVLALDRPINELLDSWKLPDNELTRATPVTLRRILSHSAGLTVHGFAGYAAGEVIPTLVQILDGVAPANSPAIRVDLAPGTRFRYSGGGTTISQLALIDRLKQPYPQILAARVLGPLGMVHSTFDQALTPERLAHAAAGHGGGGTVIPGKRHAYPEMAAAGLWTTPSDLARCFLEIAKALAGRPSKLPRSLAVEMTTPVVSSDGGGVGLGVFVRERNGSRWFGHGGADDGFQADVMVSLDGGHGVVVMTNSDNGSRIFDEIERTVFAAYGWPGTDAQIVPVALTPAERAKFVGLYAGRQASEIVERNGKLVQHRPFDPEVELVAIARDTVVARDTGRRLQRAESGELRVTLQEASWSLERVARHPLFELEAGRFDDAVAVWRERARADAPRAHEDEEQAAGLGYRLRDRDLAKAIDVFRLVAAVFPDSSSAHDSLAEAYARRGDTARAIAEYELALGAVDGDPRIAADSRPGERARLAAALAKLRR